ncbi:MAG: hypothetical protein JST54_20110 [Deltaproteobacteria bacterium]|nr:hypothetical protein [Deltaproteobacteria bacterium]
MLARFFIYGLLGWVVEVLFTGASAVLARDRAATARTYLWMHPIYGLGMLALDQLGTHMSAVSWPARAALYVAVIYAMEFASGSILRRVLGRCPWDYGATGINVRGLVRLDYAPAWYLAALLFDPVRLAVVHGINAVSVGEVLAATITGAG